MLAIEGKKLYNWQEQVEKRYTDMIDITLLRSEPELVRDNIKKKFQDKKLPLVDEAIALDAKKRALQTEGDELRAARNSLSKQIGQLMREKRTDEAEKIKDRKSVV